MFWYGHGSLIWWESYIILLPAIVLGIYAQAKVKSAFGKWSQVASRRNMTGAQAAQFLLRAAGITDVPVETSQGFLSDNYNPRDRVLRLSPDVYSQNSLAAIGVAAHETGHALQHAKGYAFLGLRSMMVPAAQSSNLWIFLFLIGLWFRSPLMMNIGIILFSGMVLFTLFTLPVEIDASRRAVAMVESTGLLTAEEVPAVKEVLTAAALTYVAAALTAILQLARLLYLRNRD
jgi:Zn-dependent membrane protease YugP